MSNEEAAGPEELRLLSELCDEAARGHEGDYAATWADLCRRLDGLPTAQRTRLDQALRRILRFRPPPTRSSQ